MHKLSASVFLAFALLCGLKTVASTQRQRPVVRISLSVDAADGLNSRITSYLSRELRKIDDVTITDTNPLYRINCVALKTISRGGENLGYALSFVVTSTMPSTFTSMFVRSKLSADDLKTIQSWNNNDGVVVQHFVQICGPDDIRTVCAQLVAQIDGSLIESARKFAQDYIESSSAQGDTTSDLRAPRTVAQMPGLDFEPSASNKRSYTSAINAAEVSLNTVYNELRTKLASRQRDALKREELEWIAAKEKTAEDSEERLSMIRHRTSELQQRLNH